jgi:hypothetical protein
MAGDRQGSYKERRMRLKGGWLLAAALLAVVLSLSNPRAFAQTVSNRGNVTVKWSTQAIVNVALTPNYASGFGQVPAVIGTQPAPTHGPNAGPSVGQGDVDFGNVLAGKNYLYKYATQLTVNTNDPNGFNLYGEGAADFFNTTDSTSVPISSAVYYLSSTSGSPADPNTGFSPASPFMKTGGVVSGGGYSGPPATITYTTYPSPIASTVTNNSTLYYDYQLKVPPTATQGLYYVWIVFTAVAK